MNWYVMQTMTGGEEKLVSMIDRLIPMQLYGECFVVYLEQFWRRRQRSLVHVSRAFPGYVFITSDMPDQLFLNLKQVPAMSKLMAGDNFYFLAMDPAEAEFLGQIMNENHVIRLSYLATNGRGHIFQVSGPLKACLKQVVRYNYRKRSAVVRLRLAGAEKQVPLGIVLNEDLRRELLYGKVETPVRMPERYVIPRSAEPAIGTGGAHLSPGDAVTVICGELAGMTGTVSKIKKRVVKICIHFLGQQLEMEVPAEDLQKTA